MKKYPDNIECPFDNFLYNLCDHVAPFFKKTGHTANMITFYAVIIRLIALKMLYDIRKTPVKYKQKLWYFIILWALGYFFDSLDGFMARKYNMQSEFGQKFDYYSDVIMDILLFIIIWLNYRSKIGIFSIFFVILIVADTLMNCQKILHWNNNTNTDFYNFCSNNIKWLRYIGIGLLRLSQIILVYIIVTKSN